MLGRLSPLLLVATATAEFTAPAFAWNLKGVKGDQHHGPVSGSDVERLISSSQREVNVVFLADSLTTEDVKEYGAKLPALQGFLRDLPSLTLPFTTAHDVRLFEHTGARISAAAAEEYFKSNAHLFSNGKPDVVVVELANKAGASIEEQLAEYDAALSRISQVVHKGTAGNYAALFTSGRHAHRRLLKSKGAYAGAYLHTTPTLLTAQLVMLILMVIFLSGFCCLFSLQTPKRFEEVKTA